MSFAKKKYSRELLKHDVCCVILIDVYVSTDEHLLKNSVIIMAFFGSPLFYTQIGVLDFCHVRCPYPEKKSIDTMEECLWDDHSIPRIRWYYCEMIKGRSQCRQQD